MALENTLFVQILVELLTASMRCLCADFDADIIILQQPDRPTACRCADVSHPTKRHRWKCSLQVDQLFSVITHERRDVNFFGRFAPDPMDILSGTGLLEEKTCCLAATSPPVFLFSAGSAARVEPR